MPMSRLSLVRVSAGIESWLVITANLSALAQGQVAMITEWSAFYGTLTDPKTSKLGDCLGVPACYCLFPADRPLTHEDLVRRVDTL